MQFLDWRGRYCLPITRKGCYCLPIITKGRYCLPITTKGRYCLPIITKGRYCLSRIITQITVHNATYNYWSLYLGSYPCADFINNAPYGNLSSHQCLLNASTLVVSWNTHELYLYLTFKITQNYTCRYVYSLAINLDQIAAFAMFPCISIAAVVVYNAHVNTW